MYKPIVKLSLGDIVAEVPLELTKDPEHYTQESLEEMALQKLKVRANNEFDIRQSKKENRASKYGALNW